MKTVLVTTSSFAVQDPGPLNRLKAKGLQVVLNPFQRKLSEPEVSDLIKTHGPVGIIAGVEPLTRAALTSSENLKIVSRCGIGMDSVDLEAARELGITVTNTPDAPTVPVAELTIGLILALLRGITTSDAGIRQGKWIRPMGHLLQDKTVGIIGCGRIGSRVAKLLSAFRCKVLGYDPAALESDYFESANLDELLAQADIVTLHLPYSDKTRHIINTSHLRAMKKGAFLINASRGGLVDEQALCACLQGGHIAGAALDSFEQEPYNGPLIDFENVILTGHIGSYAREGRVFMEEQAVDNLLNEIERLEKM